MAGEKITTAEAIRNKRVDNALETSRNTSRRVLHTSYITLFAALLVIVGMIVINSTVQSVKLQSLINNNDILVNRDIGLKNRSIYCLVLIDQFAVIGIPRPCLDPMVAVFYPINTCSKFRDPPHCGEDS